VEVSKRPVILPKGVRVFMLADTDDVLWGLEAARFREQLGALIPGTERGPSTTALADKGFTEVSLVPLWSKSTFGFGAGLLVGRHGHRSRGGRPTSAIGSEVSRLARTHIRPPAARGLSALAARGGELRTCRASPAPGRRLVTRAPLTPRSPLRLS